MAISVADNFQYLGTKPLDARLKFASVSDMASTAAASLYDGCFAYVTATKKYYSYDSTNDVDQTLGKWREFTSGSSSADVVSGYYNSTDHLFYEENTYTTAITGKANVIYISLDTDKTYRFNGSIFVRLDYEEGQIVQIATLPTASADNLGKIYEYIGTTTLDYTNGLFYQCVFDGTSTYSWEVCDVVDTLSASDVADIKNAFAVQTYVDRGITIDLRGTEYVVGTYIDANGVEHKLWQKTFSVTTPSSATDWGYWFSVADLSIDTYIGGKGILSTAGDFIVNIPGSWATSSRINFGFLKNSNEIYIDIAGSNWLNKQAIVTIQYTKTT